MITAAELVKYNANSAGNRVGDCVKRACSIAFNMPYSQVNKEMAAIIKKSGYPNLTYANPYVYNRFFEKMGLDLRPIEVPVPERVTLIEFADIHDKGTWIVEVSSKQDTRPSHMVAIVDGSIYDSWNSTEWYVCKYREIQGGASVKLNNDFNLVDYDDDIVKWTLDAVHKNTPKYPDVKSAVRNVQLQTTYPSKYNGEFHVTLKMRDQNIPSVNFKFGIVIPPDTPTDKAVAKIKQTIDTRVYDRFYELSKKISKMTKSAPNSIIWDYNPNSLERKFLWSLPPEIANQITFLMIDHPGQFFDSYSVRVNKTCSLWAYTAEEMREQLMVGSKIGWDAERIRDEVDQ